MVQEKSSDRLTTKGLFAVATFNPRGKQHERKERREDSKNSVKSLPNNILESAFAKYVKVTRDRRGRQFQQFVKRPGLGDIRDTVIWT